MSKRNEVIVKVIAVIGLLYLFLLSISLMGAAFKGFGKGFAENLIQTTSNPFVGLFIGILATSLVQSSSTTTSITVGLVAAGGLDVTRAIPIIIGANIGTSVTNTLVSVGHISRPEEFKRAFSAATVHDFFNLIAVVIIFPIQLATNFLGRAAAFLADLGGGTIRFDFEARQPSFQVEFEANGRKGAFFDVPTGVIEAAGCPTQNM